MASSLEAEPSVTEIDAKAMLFENAVSLMSERGLRVALAFYAELLRRHPRMIAVFSDSDLNRQAGKIAAMLRVIVGNAGGTQELGHLAMKLGFSHASLGLTVADYSDFNDTLADVLAERQDVMQIDVARAIWCEELTSIAEVMMVFNSR